MTLVLLVPSKPVHEKILSTCGLVQAALTALVTALHLFHPSFAILRRRFFFPI